MKQSIVFECSHVRFHSKMNSKVLLNSEYLTRHTLGFHPTVQNVWISLQSIINSIACSREEWWGGGEGSGGGGGLPSHLALDSGQTISLFCILTGCLFVPETLLKKCEGWL